MIPQALKQCKKKGCKYSRWQHWHNFPCVGNVYIEMKSAFDGEPFPVIVDKDGDDLTIDTNKPVKMVSYYADHDAG